jgi:hypothetical protein
MTKTHKTIRNPYTVAAKQRKSGEHKSSVRVNNKNEQMELLKEMEEETTMSEVVCTTCNDTHIMNIQGWMCTRCPKPCQECRFGGYGAFCETTPCPCSCHHINDNKEDLMEWYQGPLTEERMATLRYKLARARGMLVSMIGWEKDDPELVPSTEQIIASIKETDDP